MREKNDLAVELYSKRKELAKLEDENKKLRERWQSLNIEFNSRHDVYSNLMKQLKEENSQLRAELKRNNQIAKKVNFLK